MKSLVTIVSVGVASLLGVVGCAHMRNSQGSSCHGGSCEAPLAATAYPSGAPAYPTSAPAFPSPTYAAPQAAPAYGAPAYAEPSPAAAMPQGSGMRSAPSPSYEGSGSR